MCVPHVFHELIRSYLVSYVATQKAHFNIAIATFGFEPILGQALMNGFLRSIPSIA